jgi:dipeptidyl aminopeptidase/acylaminoacyl peptidase
MKTGKKKLILEDEWDIMYCKFSKNGRYRITAVNADARTEISIYDLKIKKYIELPDIPDGDITGLNISRSGKYLAFYVNSDTSPSNLYVLYLESGGPYRCLTSSISPKIDELDLVKSAVVRYPSNDGLKIPALLYKPQQTSQGQVPALVFVHGGPGGQSRVGYSALRQFLVNQGYAVLAVNNRGSSGYGKTFNHMDDKKHGDVDLKDCVYGRKYLEGLDWIDGDRVGIIGGSYGGYMVAAALAFEPQAFNLGINIFGVTNWVRTLKNIPPWWAAARDSLYAELGDPATDEERLRKISPLFHASNIVKPLLVVQGKNDARVLKIESDELVAAAKKNGAPVEYVVFDDEGHGFMKKANRITAAKAYAKFLEQHLK